MLVDGTSITAEVAAHVTELSVVHEPDLLDHFSLTVANPYPSMPWTHTEQADWFREGNAVTIGMGYAGELRTLFDGEITSLSPAFPESGTPTVRVEGYTRLHWLRGAARSRTFQDVTDQDVAERIAAGLGLKAAAERTGARHPYLIQYNQTDLAFLVQRARAIGFEVTVDGRTLVFREQRSADRGGFRLEWGRSLRSFHPTMNTLRQVSKVIVCGYDARTKKEVRGEAGADTAAAGMGGRRTGAAVAETAFHRRVEEIRVDTPIASQEEADVLARAIYQDRALDFVTGTGSAAGEPGLRAGEVLELAGLGPAFSGPYYVAQTTHTIDASGYRTSFSVRRNAVS
ncbi:phage late control D family protein [Actinoplanes octamycinicus]|nr:hypothetical protein Aoc01nite_23690 [Actinoplanes octamycinicus]